MKRAEKPHFTAPTTVISPKGGGAAHFRRPQPVPAPSGAVEQSSTAREIVDLLATAARDRLRLLTSLGFAGFLILGLLAIAVPLTTGSPLDSSGLLFTLSISLAAVSACVWWIAGKSSVTSVNAIHLGLAYVWFSGQAMAATEVALATSQPLYQGVPGLCVWIVLFPTIIPCLPHQACLTAVGIALALPVDYAIGRMFGSAAVPMEAWGSWFVPPFFSAALATTVSVLVNRLTSQVAEARRNLRDLGSYALIRRIGVGGMGEVWMARHRLLPRHAAVKFLKISEHNKHDTQLDLRFEREAQAIAQLKSPHTVQLYDFGISDSGEPFIAMELLDGIDLDTLIRRHGRQREARVAHILSQLCLSLMEAHAKNLIHRDISPNNVMICQLGMQVDQVKVLDFGLVGFSTHGAVLSNQAQNSSQQESSVVGTPGYIAPEVLTGAPADARSDMYAIGCLGYWLLTASTLHPQTHGENLAAHVDAAVIPPSVRLKRVLDPELETLILDCLHRDPLQRPGTVADVRQRLMQLQFSEPWDENTAWVWWSQHHTKLRS